jgi:hypothetical protein
MTPAANWGASSTGYLTPAEFEEQWRKEQIPALELNW